MYVLVLTRVASMVLSWISMAHLVVPLFFPARLKDDYAQRILAEQLRLLDPDNGTAFRHSPLM